jgi:hypothetical protein
MRTRIIATIIGTILVAAVVGYVAVLGLGLPV